ncbi:MAG: 2-amino-4-hydroxy-6-hydroxymethyldihydropteridine diphosphokinase [Elusimicrobia bacterium]|nr:2-amino-4-hydroxy-6-hydroxymethyldihydropteridine diphosphokinase [Elusimicrobiota bacterium]
MKHLRVFVGLGSNVGNRLGFLRAGLTALGQMPGTKLMRVSRIYETSPVGPRQRPFMNAAAEIRTELSPVDFLKEVKDMEKKIGRKKRRRWGPREIDIDVLFFGSRRIKVKGLTVPHPELARRKFALQPLLDVAPRFRDPVSGKTVDRLNRELTDPRQSIRLYKTRLFPCPK